MKRNIRVWKLSALGALAVLATQTYASGYRMEFQSASVLADAGEAAVVEDAGTNWYNAAGLVYLPRQLVMSAIDVYAPVTFKGSVNAPSTVNMLGLPAFASNFVSTGSASSYPNNVIPAMHLSMPVNDRVALGFSVAPAWGFSEDYGENSILRYNLTRIYTRTLDLVPNIAWKMNDQWSFGIGPDINYFSVESKSHVRTQGQIVPGVGTSGDSTARFSTNSWNVGGHVGILYRMSDQTRVGFNYRSKIMMKTEGYSGFSLDTLTNGAPGGYYEANNFKLPIALPPSTTLSVYHDMTPTWALMGTIAYDQWSTIRNYHGRNYAQPPIPPSTQAMPIPDVTIVQDMHNTIDVSVGTHYKLNDKWMLRGSLKYEPTPTQDDYRNVNFPDGVKYGINLGARYQINHCLAMDVIYGHVFVKNMQINDVNPTNGATASGHTNSSIDLLGGQLVWNL